MTTTTNTAPVPAPASQPTSGQLDLQALERAISTSRPFAWCIIAGLPALGVVASVLLHLPLFAIVMAGSFGLMTGLICYRAVATFTGKTLRLLVAARLVIILVLAACLAFTTGAVWAVLVSAVLTWLVADRLLGRRALYDLWRLVRSRP
jgi:hypothetical protein